MIDFLYGVALIVSSYAFPSSEKMTSSVARFGEEETIQLIQLLTSYLGQSLVLNVWIAVDQLSVWIAEEMG